MLRSITWCVAVIMIVTVCMLDSESWIPAIAYVACVAFLIIRAGIELPDRDGGKDRNGKTGNL